MEGAGWHNDAGNGRKNGSLGTYFLLSVRDHGGKMSKPMAHSLDGPLASLVRKTANETHYFKAPQ